MPPAVRRLVVMGGAEAAGNITPTAEYNFHCDAEAAALTLRKFPQLVLVRCPAACLPPLPAGSRRGALCAPPAAAQGASWWLQPRHVVACSRRTAVG